MNPQTLTHPLDRLTQPERNLEGLRQNAVAIIERGRPSANLFRLYSLWHWVELAYWLNYHVGEVEAENARLRAMLDERQPVAWPVSEAAR